MNVIRNSDIVGLWNTIEAIKSKQLSLSTKIAYALARNRRKIQDIIDSIQEAAKPSEQFLEYDKKRNDIVVKHTKSNGDGSSIIDHDNMRRELDALEGVFDEVLKKEKEKQKEVSKLLKEEATIELYRMPLEAFPDTTTTDIIDGLLPMLDHKT